MRMILAAAAVLLAQAAPAGAAMSYEQVASTRCPAFLSVTGGGAGGSDRFFEVQEPLVEFFDQRDQRQVFGSACNIIDYVRAECRRNTRQTVGDAVTLLFGKAGTGRPLPRIPRCGA